MAVSRKTKLCYDKKKKKPKNLNVQKQKSFLSYSCNPVLYFANIQCSGFSYAGYFTYMSTCDCMPMQQN